jgi:methionine aminotransferase
MITSFSPVLDSKLPQVGTTIFTVMSGLAAEYEAINLSQGFPNFETSRQLTDLMNLYMKKGLNQYAPMTGVQVLREAIAHKTEDLYGVRYHPETEITITSGATEALYAAISAVVRPGDEVIVFEPAYDSYVPAIQLNGGIPVFITLTPPDYAINWESVRQKLSDKTKLIILNTPHNPTGKVISTEDLQQLAAMVKDKDIFLIGDEVYEHIVFDGLKHNSLLSNPVLQERSFICSSFGKTFHITGWKVGYCLAPAALTREFRKIHQYLVFSTFTPVQFALAEYLTKPEHYLSLPAFYEAKRNKFLSCIQNSRFTYVPAQGSFFQLLSYKNITEEHDYDLAIRLTKEIGVASIPVSAFYERKNDYQVLRFCFAKDDETLEKAGERLNRL